MTGSLTVKPTASQNARTITVSTPEIQLAGDAGLLRLLGTDGNISLMLLEYRSDGGPWLPVLAPQKTLETGRQVPDGRWLWSEIFWSSWGGKTEIDADAWHVDTILDGAATSFAQQRVRKKLSVPGTELRVLIVPHAEFDLKTFDVELQRSMP